MKPEAFRRLAARTVVADLELHAGVLRHEPNLAAPRTRVTNHVRHRLADRQRERLLLGRFQGDRRHFADERDAGRLQRCSGMTEFISQA